MPNPEIRVGMSTPWGVADFVAHIERSRGHAITRVDTPSHGGYYVPNVLVSLIPIAHREYAARWSGSVNWYEEDCAWAYVALAFPELFPAAAAEHARTTAEWITKNAKEG